MSLLLQPQYAETPLPRMSKFEVAQRILDEALALREDRQQRKSGRFGERPSPGSL